MTYLAQAQLTEDQIFASRSRAAGVQQAELFKDDQRAPYVAVASAILRDESQVTGAFLRINAGGPGIADRVDVGDGTIDQSKVTDADLLSLTQANWPVVADLFYDSEGAPLP